MGKNRNKKDKKSNKTKYYGVPKTTINNHVTTKSKSIHLIKINQIRIFDRVFLFLANMGNVDLFSVNYINKKIKSRAF